MNLSEILQDHEIYEAIGLVVFAALVVWYGVHTTLGRLLDQRGQAIAQQLDEAQRLRTEAETLLASYKKKAGEAEREAAAILESAREEAALLQKEGREQVEALIRRRTAMAETKIAQAEAQALAEVKTSAAAAAVGAARELLTQRIDVAKANALADSAIRDLRARLN